MVDVSEKAETVRKAKAVAELKMAPATLELVREGRLPKGDVASVVRLAGIQAAKKTSDLIPLCHPLSLDAIDVDIDVSGEVVIISAEVSCTGRTGVEMEALTAVTVAALAFYDMVKGVDKDVTIENVRLLEKSGGRSGTYHRG